MTESEIKSALKETRGDVRAATELLASGEDPFREGLEGHSYSKQQNAFPEPQRVLALLNAQNLQKAKTRCERLVKRYSRMEEVVLSGVRREDLVDFLLCVDADLKDPKTMQTLEKVSLELERRNRSAKVYKKTFEF